MWLKSELALTPYDINGEKESGRMKGIFSVSLEKGYDCNSIQGEYQRNVK